MADKAEGAPISGAIPYTVGQASIVRIPIPGTENLCIEFKARGWTPAGGSTSTLYFQDPTGKKHLRLDYGHNVKTNSINYHWNQNGTHAKFGITDHASAGKFGKAAHRGARYFRYAGRSLFLVGAVVDGVSIVQSNRPIRRASEVASAWALAWVGCKAVGAGGAAAGTYVAPGYGTAVGGVGGCIVGGIGGYFGGEKVGAAVYDWAEDTYFTSLPEANAR